MKKDRIKKIGMVFQSKLVFNIEICFFTYGLSGLTLEILGAKDSNLSTLGGNLFHFPINSNLYMMMTVLTMIRTRKQLDLSNKTSHLSSAT